MKHIISTILFSTLLTLFSYGQNSVLSVSGYVFDTITGIGISNHIVTAEVMSGGMVTTLDMATDNSGYYTDSIVAFDQGDLLVFTMDCMGNLHSNGDNFGPNNYSFSYDFYICADSMPSDCNANFSWFLPPIGGTTVFFTNNSWGNPTWYFWDFGDGTYSGDFEPTHEFPASGTYTVCLTISTADSSCYDVYCEDVTVEDNGTGDCENFFWYETWNMVDFAFMGESLPVPADYYYWDFGDGQTAYGQEVMHTYSLDSAEVVMVTLTTWVYDPATGDTCMTSSEQEVWIGGSGNDCENFFWSETFDSYTFDFTGEGIPPADDYIWEFGDGNSAYGQNVQHSYDPNFTGEVTVSLTTVHFTAGTADTCMAFSSQTIIVGDSIYEDCLNFFWYQSTATNSFQFNGQAYPDAEYYAWDFGDGQTAYGQIADHTFDPSLGEVFVVTLTSAGLNPAGDTCIASSSQEVWITNTGWDCENWFWYESWDFVTFDFMGESFPFPADEFYWDLGDGTTAMGPAITHTYEADPGEMFNVTLTTMGYDPATGDSCIAVSVQEIYIGGWVGDCENIFWYDSGNDFTYDFVGEAFPAPADEYFWSFGDGTTESGQFVSHTFDPAQGNSFLVCLTSYSTINGDSCWAESCQEIILGGQSGVEIYGTIYADNEPADVALVGLFGADPNVVFYEFTLTQPGTGSYHFENIPEGDYYIFTSLTPQSEKFYDYFPTYYGDAIFWFDAELLSFGTPSNPYDINLVSIESNATGPGSISGMVTMEDGKGGPGENITLLLMDVNENPLDYTSTSSMGEFIFKDLAYGNYKLKVELPGLISEVAYVELGEVNQQESLQFYIQDNTAYLDIEENSSAIKTIGNIFPNPVTSKAMLEIGSLKDMEIILQVIDQTGRVILQSTNSLNIGNQVIEIETTSLLPGFYYLQVIGNNGKSLARKFIK